MQINTKTKILAVIAGLILLVALLGASLKAINSWFSKHELVFNKVLQITLQKPIEVKVREPKVEKLVLDYPDEIDTPIEKYICDKFGVYDCKTALAINAAEGNFQDEVFRVNTNGSVDFGCWQINSIHIRSGSITMKDALDCYKATDWAYDKFVRDGGFGAWVAYTNGSFISKLE